MARKKQEIALQRELETQEEWEECMAMEGLWVVDVYQEWCGPCQALQGNFKRLNNELGDPLLKFAIAKSDTIDALDQYRGRCEPTFLFYAGGILVGFVHGANAPKVLRTITEQLAHEHKVIEGQAERKEVKDQVMTRSQERELQKAETEEANREAEANRYVKTPKVCTVCIIKPDAVAAGKTDEIIEEIQSRGIEIVAQESRELTEEEATSLYEHLAEEEYYSDMIKFICSGPSHVMVLTSGASGETVIDDIRGLLGPPNVEEAKENEPDSLRAKYGDNSYMNGIHGSSSKETAARELAFFFPNLNVPTYLKKKENIQRTLAVIRPSAFASNKDEIIEKIKEAGFTIALSREVKLNKEQAAQFYGEHVGQPYFDQLIEEMSSGPVLCLGLARDDAISAWREMLGPPNLDDAQEQAPDSQNTLRAQFGAASGVNQFHGSDSEAAAKKEMDFFFPMEQTVAVIKPSGIGEKDMIIEKIHEAGFRIAARKETTIQKDIVDLMYPEQVDKDYYNDLVEHMTGGETMFMVLTREGAVDGWRSLIGPTDPEVAREKAPLSVRAVLGSSLLENAVHGASNAEAAKAVMVPVFGELKFNEDGTLQGEAPDLDPATIDGDMTVDTTMDQTTVDPDTTDITANATMDMTAGDATEGDTTAAVDETTAADTTEGDTTMADTTVADTTMADTTVADTTVAETGGEGEATTAEETTAEAAASDETTAADTTAEATTEGTVDATADETTAAETTAEATTVEQTQDTPSEDKAEPAAETTEQASAEPPKESSDSAEKPSEEKPASEEAPKKDETSAESQPAAS